jgi:hypothetical protein
VKTPITIALAVATALSGSLAALAQSEPPTVHHHYHHHYVPHHATHHHYVASPAPTGAPVVVAPPPQTSPLGLAWPHIAPYPDGRGDEDGLSEDTDDCNKGCIDGNTPD